MKALYLIDNSNFIYRYKSVHKYASVNVNGVSIDISTLVGYIKSLKNTIFDDICIVLDGDPVKNKSLLSSYKGTRLHELEDKSISVPRTELIKFLTQIGTKLGKNIKVICAPHQEADQVISSVAHFVSKNLPARWSLINGLNNVQITQDKYLKSCISSDLQVKPIDLSEYDSVVIASTDADMAQLQILDNVLIDTSTSGKTVSSERTADSVDYISPKAIPCYKALYGDASDNIPGLKLSLRKQDVLKTLNDNIQTIDDVNNFYKLICGFAENDKLKFIAKEVINTNQVKDFIRNWDITKLDFYSIPIELSYSDYDINTTIEKYRLRI